MAQLQVIFGLHTVEAAIRYDPQRVVELWIDSGRKDARVLSIVEQARAQGIAVQEVSKKALNRLTDSARHQGVAAKYHQPKTLSENDLMDRVAAVNVPFLLILDGIQDPHNLGACLRSADAAGVHGVVLAKDRSVGLTPTVRKVASGAADSVPIYTVTNLVRTMQQLQKQGIWLYGFDDSANKYYCEADFATPLALVFGTEGKGLRQLTQKTIDLTVKIPMLGRVDSLNLSVATSIGLFEVQRQRMLINKKG